LESEYQPWTGNRLKTFSLFLLRFVFWWFFANVFIHIFYFSSMHYNLSIMRDVDLWTLCGIGFAIGQFFQLKYVVFYGFPRAFFYADGIEDIPAPKCISRIHLYSDMWRHFDVGLYRFMHK
jgi:hypothetical protein